MGGHNPIEAAICQLPLVMGPETFNFPDVVAAFSDAGCLDLVTDAEALAVLIGDYLGDDGRRQVAGVAAARVVAENTGAMERLLDLLSAEVRAVAGYPPPVEETIWRAVLARRGLPRRSPRQSRIWRRRCRPSETLRS